MRLRSSAAIGRWRHVLLYAASLGTALTAACSDVPTAPHTLPVTVSGTITNRSGATIPAHARAVVLWSSDDGSGDYAYIFGEGTLDRATNRFTITFEGNVPGAALYDGALGVGLVILTTDPNLREGRVPDGYDYATSVIGVTGQHAVIYLDTSPSRYGSDWPVAFPRGYNVGRGIDLPGAFDGFAPADRSSMELLVDDLANIEVVNWT